ncbi:MAG: FG-GAP-like repeat-containing protein [Pirellulales bacterium]
MSLDLTDLVPTDDVAVLATNLRWNSSTGRYVAEISLRNDGQSLGRGAAVAFEGLPNGVTVANRSGTTADGKPYLNLRPTITASGLVSSATSLKLEVTLDDPQHTPFALLPRVLIDAAAPPEFDPVGPFEVTPGDVLDIALSARDDNGDPVAIMLEGVDDFPTAELTSNQHLIIRPTPDQIGRYDFVLVASDGDLETRRQVRLDVVAGTGSGTRIAGKVLGVDRQPLVGMPVSIGNVQGLTNEEGSFVLNLGSGPPVSDTLKVRGDLYSGPDKYPFIAEQLPLLLQHPVFSEVENVIDRPIYLPKLGAGQPVNPTADTTVNSTSVAGASVFVAAGTLFDLTGTPFTDDLSITEVPVDSTPAALPSNLLPDLVVTIQPGELVFATPAPLTLPNRAQWPAGAVMDLWSINPVTGQFDLVGIGQVSNDGAHVTTISGGIRNASWHFFAPQLSEPRNDSQDQTCTSCEAKRNLTSEVELHSGVLRETHSLVTYQSLGVTRGVVLNYDSLRADPRPVIRFSYNVDGSLAPLNSVAASALRIMGSSVFHNGQFAWRSAGNTGETSTLLTGQSFWNVDDLTLDDRYQRVGGGLQVDFTHVPSGIYPYELATGLYRFTDTASSGGTTTLPSALVHVNLRSSPFGNGWGLSGYRELVEMSDGSILIWDGDGTELAFEPPQSPGQSYQSPAGHFGTLVSLGANGFTHTLTDGTVWSYSPQGQLLSVRDRHGNVTRYEYDLGRLVRIIDPANLTTTFHYSGSQITSIEDPTGRTTALDLDAAGDLVRISDPDGATRQWTYDNRHLMVTEIDPRGFREEAEYDQFGRITAAVRADGSQVAVAAPDTQGLYPAAATSSFQNAPPAFVGLSHQAAYRDGNQVLEVIELDARGQELSSRDPLGVSFEVKRNVDGLITRFTNARRQSTIFRYDSRGNLMETQELLPADSMVHEAIYADSVLFSSQNFEAFTVADLNEDDIPDLVTDGASILMGMPDGSFDTPLSISNVGQGLVAIGDLNVDGHLDLVVGGAAFRTASLFYGDGQGGFQSATVTVPTPNFQDLILRPTIADLDGDGVPEIIFTTQAHDLAYQLRRQPDGQYVASAFNLGFSANPAGTKQVWASDLNADGRADLVVNNFGSQVGLVTLITDPTGVPRTNGVLASSQDVKEVLVADVNRDGRIDIATPLQLYLGAGDGTFTQPPLTISGGDRFSNVNLGDVDGDQINDLVTTVGSQLRYYRGRADGALDSAPTVVPATVSYDFRLLDINRDRILDLVWHNGATLGVSLGRDDGTFEGQAPLNWRTPSRSPSNIASADFNEDGLADLVGTFDSSFDGELVPQVKLATAPGTFGLATPIGSLEFGAQAGQQLKVLDVNTDGHMDIVTYGSFNGVYVFNGLGNGQFASPSRIPGFVNGADIGDLDNDHILDLVTTDGNAVKTYRGRSDGTYDAPNVINLGAGFRSVAIGDVSNDNQPDLVLVNQSSGLVTLLALGSGQFSSPIASAGTATARNGVIADMNGDGRADVLTVDDHVQIWLGMNDGTFVSNQVLTEKSTKIVALDLDLDGDTDLVNGDQILVNDGAGHLTSKFLKSPAAAAADLNNDQLPDLIGVEYTSMNTANRSSVLAIKKFEYSLDFSQLVRFTDERGNVTTYEVSPTNGDRLSTTWDMETAFDPMSIETYTYTSQGLIASRLDSLGRMTTYQYDAVGRPISVTYAADKEDESTERFEYDAAGNQTAFIDGNQHRWETTYDVMNRVISRRDPLGNGVTTAYDPMGNSIEQRDAAGYVTQLQFDARNRLISTTDPLGNQRLYTRDPEGNIVSERDPNGAVSTFVYDARNRQIRATDQLGATTTTTYDPDGNRVAIQDPLGNTTRWIVDSRDRVTSEIDPLGAKLLYTYDVADRLISRTDRNGRIVNYEYDGLDRMTRETWIDVSGATVNDVSYTYNSKNLLSIEDTFSQLSFSYDARDRMATVSNVGTTEGPEFSLRYMYDGAENVVEVADSIDNASDVITSYVRDGRDQVAQILQSGAGSHEKRVDFSYDPRGGISSVTRFDALSGGLPRVVTTQSYDSNNRIDHIQHMRQRPGSHAGSVVTEPLVFFGLSYDQVGRPLQFFDTSAGGVNEPPEVTQYGYDAHGQLISVDHQSTVGLDEEYHYDLNGNRLFSSVSGGTYVVGSANRLLSDGNSTYEYDGEGNLVKSTDHATGIVRHFTWDHRNRLIEIVDTDDQGVEVQRVRFSYDTLNRRISKEVTTPTGRIVTYFVYDREDVIATYVDTDGVEGPASMALDQRFLHGPAVDQVLAQEDAAGYVQWYLTDHLGTVRDLVHAPTGAIQQFTYDTYGNPLAYGGIEVGTRYGFTGRELDLETNLYSYRLRYYSSALGQFVSEDPLRFSVGETNLDEYAHNSPVQFVDPMGLSALDFYNSLTTVISVVGGVAAGVMVNKIALLAGATPIGAFGWALFAGILVYKTLSDTEFVPSLSRAKTATVSFCEVYFSGPFIAGRILEKVRNVLPD